MVFLSPAGINVLLSFSIFFFFQVVVSHDNHLDRVTGDDLHISDLHFDVSNS